MKKVDGLVLHHSFTSANKARHQACANPVKLGTLAVVNKIDYIYVDHASIWSTTCKMGLTPYS